LDFSVVLSGGDKGTQVLSPQIAREEVQVLRAVTQYGTGTTAALADRPTAGKTGTTDIFSNAWFDGFTPQLTTVVWVGSPIGNVSMYSVGGKSASGNYLYYRTVYGATYPSMIWHQFMGAALQGQPVIPFIAPDPLQLGRKSYIATPPGSYSSSYSPPVTSRRSTSTTSPGDGNSLPTLPGAGGGPPTTSSGGVPPTRPPATSPATTEAPAPKTGSSP
jgi:penicillin-binding protein 1A